MKAEVIDKLSPSQLQEAYNAYNHLAMIYEDAFGGPYGARQFREYFGIMDSRESIRKRYYELMTGKDGKQ